VGLLAGSCTLGDDLSAARSVAADYDDAVVSLRQAHGHGATDASCSADYHCHATRKAQGGVASAQRGEHHDLVRYQVAEGIEMKDQVRFVRPS